jgi:Transcriptional regulators containing a DNA-binding HTH domain and an aminotransferase domain (MocR family) and their eukaryotic orthologs
MLYLELDRMRTRSYTKQIYTQIRKKIISGVLRANEKLQSTRELSKDLSVARNTVLNAYDMLLAEGLIYSMQGAGFFVSPQVAYEYCPSIIEDLSSTSLSDLRLKTDVINFDSGMPALDLFPKSKWNHVSSAALNEAPISALGYDDPQGRLELREVLSRYLKRSRGIECKPEQIIVTSGTKQGITLVAKCLLNAESEVWIENPTNDNVRQIFSYHTEKLLPLEVDEEGIIPDLFPTDRKPNLIFATPSHQFPLGGILSAKRRFELINFARQSNAFILEDDYDSEFTYEGPTPNSLFELDSERVIYAGTFSKTMFPSIRLGYLVVPPALIPQIRKWKRLADHNSNSIYQLALMRFIESGELERHIRRMKREYRRRRDNLIILLQEYFGEKVKIYGTRAGMHLVAEFKDIVFNVEIINAMLESGIYIVPVENHSAVKGIHTNQIILGYAQLSRENMVRGLEMLKAAVFNQQ